MVRSQSLTSEWPCSVPPVQLSHWADTAPWWYPLELGIFRQVLHVQQEGMEGKEHSAIPLGAVSLSHEFPTLVADSPRSTAPRDAGHTGHCTGAYHPSTARHHPVPLAPHTGSHMPVAGAGGLW